MADFCFDCTEHYFGDEYAPQNDFVGRAARLLAVHGNDEERARAVIDTDVSVLGLCEGCGFHFFTNDGRRLCQPRSADPSEVFVDDICEACRDTEGV